jgi:superfamily I DNA/RNA helicase
MVGRQIHTKILVCVLILAVSTLSGCAKPPTQEMEKAEKAIADAKQKEADVYVPDLFAKAEDSLKKAKDFISGKKYKEAKEAAEQTATLAQQASSGADSTKTKMKAEVEQMLQDGEKAIDELKALLTKSAKKMARNEPKQVREKIENWEKETGSIKTLLQGGKIKQAHEQSKAMMEQIRAQKERLTPLPPEKDKDK